MADSLDFEKELENYLPINKEHGRVVRGKIIRKDADFAYVDINDKKEGIISLSELSDKDEIGCEIEAQISKIDDDYINISILALERKKQLELIEVGQVLSGKITKQLKGGYNVKSGILNLFLPFSLSAIKKGSNAIGKEISVIVKSKNAKKVLVSRTELLNKALDDFYNKYQVGDKISGKVTKILSFGAVVSLDTMNGFIHISEIAWENVDNIDKFLKLNEVKEFKIISIDKEDKNIKLSLKQLTENPWESTKNIFKVGDVVESTVKEIYSFGAIVSLPENVDGFLHISDITTRKIGEVSNVLSVGDKLNVQVTDINDEKQRIQVSARVLLEKVLNNLDKEYQLDQELKGHVVNVQDYGIFVELDNKVEVFIHRNEFTWLKDNPEYKVGDEVSFKLIKIDTEEKKLSGSIRKMTPSPWQEAADLYKVGDILDVYISDVIDAGALVPLSETFKALIPKKELAIEFIENASDVVNVGDQVRVSVLEVNPEKRSIILSIREVLESDDQD